MAKRSAYRSKKKITSSSGADLGSISTEALARELANRQKVIEKLRKRRERLVAQLHQVEADLHTFGGALGLANGRVRARNTQSLADALADLLKNKVMSVTEAADAVRAAGYQTTSANFRTIVNQTLIKDERFENVSRGKYKAR